MEMNMSISELTEKIKSAGRTRTHKQRMKLLREARILDANGELDKEFFSSGNSDNNSTIMNDIADDRVGPMLNPPHLGELIRESMDDVGWNMTQTAAYLGCGRGTLSRLLNCKTGVSASMALALEDIGWGTANHWMRMQASYQLAMARRDRADAKRHTDALHV